MSDIGAMMDDSNQHLREMIDRERERPNYAMDSYFYRSPLVYAKELDALVFKSWLYAAHVSEIPNPGDYTLFDIGDDSIIIVRDNSGDIRALMNICRHRGARVCEASSGSEKAFVCPYHGWVYNIDGSLRSARHMNNVPGFDRDSLGLKKVRIEIYMGMVYVNCDPHAADFRGPLENLAQPLGAYDLANAKVAHKELYSVEANWKFCLENYLECYHCATSHRAYARMHTFKDPAEKTAALVQALLERTEQVTGVVGMGKVHRRVFADAEGFGACVSHDRYGLYDGYITGSEDGKAVAPLMGHIKGYDGGAGDFQMGPLTSMLCYPDHCVLYRFIPRGITRTDMEVVWLVNGSAQEGVDYDKDKLIWLWHNTSVEDKYIIDRNAAGANSRFFEPGPYQPEFEATLMDFVKWYLQTLEQAAASKAGT